MKHLKNFHKFNESYIDSKQKSEVLPLSLQVEDWVKWTSKNIPNENQQKRINDFLYHYHLENSIQKQKRILLQQS